MEDYTMDEIWQPLSEKLFVDDVISLSCDTRDFNCYVNKKEHRDIKDITTLIKYKGAFFFTITEVYDILLRLLKDSGGEAEWRMLTFKENSNWFKYIRTIKTEHGYVLGADFGRDTKFFKRSFWFVAEIEGKHLHAH